MIRKIKFITGPAGTGKSYLLRKMLKEEKRSHLICAPTGIAAVNVNGSTIHRTFKVNTDSGYVGKRWHDVEVVYIDEASMMGAKLFEAALAGAPNAEFVLVGDMAQLPPVKDKFWFQSPYVFEIGGNIEIERLKVNYRQANDMEFGNILNDIRDGSIQRDDLRWMYAHSCHPDDNTNAVVIAFRNDTVRAINAEKLLSLDGEMYHYPAEYGGAMKPQDCIAEMDLTLKIGAEVIMLNNQEGGYWFNGTRASIHSFGEDDIRITVPGELLPFIVQRNTWQMKTPQDVTPARRIELEEKLQDETTKNPDEIRHWLQTGIEYVIIGSCKQFPIKLAYAMTVHKSQGMTLDAVHIITSGFAGCHGIGYVAMSRARTLETVSLDRKPVPNDFKFNQTLKNYI